MTIHNTAVYIYKNNIYINLTNRCTAQCAYCIKYQWEWRFRGYSLRMDQEPSSQDVINMLNTYRLADYQEAVFCGYGEPVIRLDVLKDIARYLKDNNMKVRLNTSGHGNLIHKRNIVPELAGLIDAVSVSVNAENAEQYMELHKPVFGIRTFDEICIFLRECKKYIPQVIMTTIDLPDNWKPGMRGINVDTCRTIASQLQVSLHVRPYLNTYKDS